MRAFHPRHLSAVVTVNLDQHFHPFLPPRSTSPGHTFGDAAIFTITNESIEDDDIDIQFYLRHSPSHFSWQHQDSACVCVRSVHKFSDFMAKVVQLHGDQDHTFPNSEHLDFDERILWRLVCIYSSAGCLIRYGQERKGCRDL